ncbi:hypothetical protein SOVF_138490 [Spinacia oleracea]|nr:hypothetical protein SOVF_138490 [Spinacia oleracea]
MEMMSLRHEGRGRRSCYLGAMRGLFTSRHHQGGDVIPTNAMKEEPWRRSCYYFLFVFLAGYDQSTEMKLRSTTMSSWKPTGEGSDLDDVVAHCNHSYGSHCPCSNVQQLKTGEDRQDHKNKLRP